MATAENEPLTPQEEIILTDDQMRRLLCLFAHYAAHEWLCWTTHLNFYVLVNDFFAPCVDGETIESDDDIDLLEKTFDDLRNATDHIADRIAYAPPLYVARKRQMMPQQRVFEKLPAPLQPLFRGAASLHSREHERSVP